MITARRMGSAGTRGVGLAPAVSPGMLPAMLLALLLLACGFARPCAAADESQFSATVPVDATADNVAKARDLARLDGERRALNAVVDRLSGNSGKSLKLSDAQVTDLVASFEVANEKMSAVRYVADYTFHFRAAELTKAMQAAGISIVDTSTPGPPGPGAPANPASPPAPATKPVVILPVLQDAGANILWDDPNPWRQAWAQRAAAPGGPQFLLPLGDVSDLADIDGDKAVAGDAASLSAIAKKEGADEVLVMLAVPRSAAANPGLDVTVRAYRGGQLVDTHADSIDGAPGANPTALYSRAADAIAADIANGWKNAKTPGADQMGSLTVVASIAGLDDWIRLRDRLAGLPAIRKVDVRALSRQQATIDIEYTGSIDQLKASLAAVNLDLTGGDPNWRLARSGGAP